MKVCDKTFQAILDCIERGGRKGEKVPRGWVPGGLTTEGGALILGFFLVYIYIYIYIYI